MRTGALNKRVLFCHSIYNSRQMLSVSWPQVRHGWKRHGDKKECG